MTSASKKTVHSSLGRLKAQTRRVVELLEAAYGVPSLRASDPLEALIRAVLSQNTTDINSDRAYRRLTERFPDWHAVKKARVSSIERAIRCGGLANVKAPRIKEILSTIEEKFGKLSLDAVCPMSLDDALACLCTLPGVGVKTVAVVLLFACGKDICPVDTHVHRLVRRIGLIEGRASRDRTFFLLAELVPKGKGPSLHINLIRHGRAVCKSQRPGCDACLLRRLCAHRKTQLARCEGTT